MHGASDVVKASGRGTRNAWEVMILRDASHAVVAHPFTRVAFTPWLRAPGDASALAASRFVWTARRLPTLFRTPMIAHALTPRLTAPSELHALVARLSGRLAVVNPVGAARLPSSLAAAVRGLVRGALDRTAIWFGADTPTLHPRAGVTRGRDLAPLSTAEALAARERRLARALLERVPSDTAARLAGGVAWAALALYESRAPLVRFQHVGAAAGGPTDLGSPNEDPVVELGYRLAIVAGSATPGDWDVLDAAALAAPALGWPPAPSSVVVRAGAPVDHPATASPWFLASMLVPDSWLAAHADEATLARWARLTGRADAADRYWYPESWERFLEPGRRIGCLTPNDVRRPRRGRLASAPDAGETDGDDRPFPSRGSTFPPSALTPDLERGVCVPPGYALVRGVGTLSVAVLVV